MAGRDVELALEPGAQGAALGQQQPAGVRRAKNTIMCQAFCCTGWKGPGSPLITGRHVHRSQVARECTCLANCNAALICWIFETCKCDTHLIPSMLLPSSETREICRMRFLDVLGLEEDVVGIIAAARKYGTGMNLKPRMA